MAIFRVHKTKDFTVMSNYHLRDKNLTLKAKGLLSIILSLPDDWKYSINGLAALCKEGKTAVKSALDELETCGYLTVTKMYPDQTDSGRIEYVYDIRETPKPQEKQGVENLPLENQCLENMTLLNTDIPNTDKPSTKRKKESKKEPTYDEIIDSRVQDEGVRDALRDFIKMRKMIKKPMTNRALTRLITRLYTFSMLPSEQVEILERSINCCWQDVYPLDSKADQKPQSDTVNSEWGKNVQSFFDLAG